LLGNCGDVITSHLNRLAEWTARAPGIDLLVAVATPESPESIEFDQLIGG
jgi:hypothetical protein